MNTIKQQLQNEATQVAIQYYNLTTELEKANKRMQEISIALNVIEAVEKEQEAEALKAEEATEE